MGKLEAIVLPITSREINTDQFSRFIAQFQHTDPKQLDLLIFINNSKYEMSKLYSGFTHLKKFKNIKIFNTNICETDDIYITQIRDLPKKIPILGAISGPNLMFFNIMRKCKNYDTILLLESDCIIKPTVFDRCVDYVNAHNFFISGSLYLGKQAISNAIRPHLNGVAFYHTGSSEFQNFIDEIELFIKKQVVGGNKIIAYDVGIYLYISLLKNSTRRPFLYSQYISNNLILNFSTTHDIDTPVEVIESLYPEHVILHKKLRNV